MASSSPPRRSDDSDSDDYDRLMSAVTLVSSPARTRKRNTDRLDSDDVPPSSLNLALQWCKWHVRIVDGTVNADSDYWILIDDDLRNIRTKAHRDTTNPKNIMRNSRASWAHPQELPRSRRSLCNYVNICIMDFRNAFTYPRRWSTWQIVHKFDTHHLSSHPTFTPCSSSWTQAELDPAGVHWTESLDST
ncbi:hypothetical protein B0H14DRAFT_2591492 [Mycena olivaceomarginata]|nr:hypothetical protein B0H14DRAFT_2591492 [Mycena olivaceomarginata]